MGLDTLAAGLSEVSPLGCLRLSSTTLPRRREVLTSGTALSGSALLRTPVFSSTSSTETPCPTLPAQQLLRNTLRTPSALRTSTHRLPSPLAGDEVKASIRTVAPSPRCTRRAAATDPTTCSVRPVETGVHEPVAPLHQRSSEAHEKNQKRLRRQVSPPCSRLGERERMNETYRGSRKIYPRNVYIRTSTVIWFNVMWKDETSE